MNLLEDMLEEKVSDLAIREPVIADPEESIRHSIEMMRASRVGCVIVVDQQNKPKGMLTEAALRQLLLENPTAIDARVGDHAIEPCTLVKVSDPIYHVLEAMQMKNVRFLCVVDDAGVLVGLTGQKGLMEYVADHFPGQVMVQRVGCAPAMHSREGA